MTEQPGTLRRIYDAFALFAVLNLLLLGGVAAWLLGGGVIDGESIRRMAEAYRAEEAVADEQPAEATTEFDAEKTEGAAGPTQQTGAQGKGQDIEMLRREADRVKAELEQRLALNNSILLRITQEREAFQREREAVVAREEKREAKWETEGFAKTISLFEDMAPNLAVDYLLDMQSLDEAARVLTQMEPRKARKVIEAARSDAQKQRMQEILRRLREVSPESSGELAQGEGT